MHVLLISGSTRAGSSNTLVLGRFHQLDDAAVTSELYGGLVDLPGFVPEADPPPTVVSGLDRVAAADAVLFSTPEYAGGLPGTLKNFLDWSVGGGQLYGKRVAWLDVANPGRGAGAREQLRVVLGYVGARIVEPACVHVRLDGRDLGVPLTPQQERSLRAVRSALVDAIEEDRHAGGS